MNRKLSEAKNETKYDLIKEFDKFNKLLFNGELKKTFPIVWSHGKVKKHLGMVSFYRQNNQITKFEIINSIELERNDFNDTLIHEMIHVYLIQNGLNDGHGPNFMRLARKFNAMGYHITIVGDSVNLKADTDKKMRPGYLLLLELKDGDKIGVLAGSRAGFPDLILNTLTSLVHRVYLFRTEDNQLSLHKRKHGFDKGINQGAFRLKDSEIAALPSYEFIEGYESIGHKTYKRLHGYK